MRVHPTIYLLVCLSLLVLACTVFCRSAEAAPAKDAAGQDLTSLVSKMEQVVFGATRPKTPLARRISNLEIHATCHTQQGSLRNRVDKLVEIIGLNATDKLPPLAPDLNAGESAAKASPRSKPADQQRTGAGRQATVSSSTSRPNPMQRADETRHLLVKAIKLHQDGKLEDAEHVFKEVLRLDPYNADACFSLGSLAEQRNDLAGALGYYSAAQVANPNDKESLNAVLQVQERIAQQQGGPFINPLTATGPSGTPTILQARAQEFTAADRLQNQPVYEQNLIPTAPVVLTPFPQASVGRPTVPTLNVGQNTPTAPRQSSGTGKAVARGIARMAVGAALNYSGLHCPLCNILRGF